jgi:solute carrier family 8 (sodium/calcium exchanger)
LFLYWLYTALGYGYAAFFVCIIAIGVMTAVIGDVASHFGCSVGIKDSITAIVFVSLGTSVPGSA